MLIKHRGKSPKVDPTAYVAPTATVVGDVTIGKGVRVLFGAIINAEGSRIEIGEGSVVTPEAGRLHVPLEEADRAADVLIALRQADIRVASVSVTRPTLDEVFLSITGHDTGQRDPAGSADDELALEVR